MFMGEMDPSLSFVEAALQLYEKEEEPMPKQTMKYQKILLRKGR